jgi:hypothetical protein
MPQATAVPQLCKHPIPSRGFPNSRPLAILEDLDSFLRTLQLRDCFLSWVLLSSRVNSRGIDPLSELERQP